MNEPSALVEAIRILPPTIAAVGAMLYARSARGEAAGANAAVNHKGEDAPSISVQVDMIDSKIDKIAEKQRTVTGDVSELHRSMASCATQIGTVSIQLERHLAHHQAQYEHDHEHDHDEERHHDPHH